MYIVDSSLTDEELGPVIEKYRQIAIEFGGEIEQAGKWEKRRLAYEVKGRHEGTYILMNFRSEAQAALELERALKLDEKVLRQLVIRLDPGNQGKIRLDKLVETRPVEVAPVVAEEVEVAPEPEAEVEPTVVAEAESEPESEPVAEVVEEPEVEAPAVESQSEEVIAAEETEEKAE